MSQERISMKKILEVLRLRFDLNCSYEKIALSCNVSSSTAREYILRFKESKLPWPLPSDFSYRELENRLFSYSPNKKSENLIDYSLVYRELKKKGVTLLLLWEELKTKHPDIYGYSRFCDLYRSYLKTLEFSCQINHVAGEKLFVDFAGKTIPIFNSQNGVMENAQIFVATLGASSYTFVYAVPSQSSENWVLAHVKALAFFGGSPEVVVPDNLKSAVIKPCRYDPDLNQDYVSFARHYDIAILPARVKKPKDKSKVESAVCVVTRWILAALRNRRFFSIDELNEAIEPLLEKLNSKNFKKRNDSRKSLFETLEKPALKPLPETPYQWFQFKKAKVSINSHIELEKHNYSVPHKYLSQVVEVCYNNNVVEVLHDGQRIAIHRRSFCQKQRYTTVSEHMPSSYTHSQWTPERLGNWALKIGPNTQEVVQKILQRGGHKEQNYKSVLGILSFAKKYGQERLELASLKALQLQVPSYKFINNILKNNRESAENDLANEFIIKHHENIRGKENYF